MAINPELTYVGKITPSSADYPYGEARNITLPGDGTGTPFLASLVNDQFGFQQAVLQAAGIVPSNNPEKATASQYLTAMQALFGNVVADLAALRAIDSTRHENGDIVHVTDGRRAGFFKLNKADAVTADDDGIDIVGIDLARWKREFTGAINSWWYGAKGDASLATDNSPAFDAARDYGELNNLPHYIPGDVGYYRYTTQYQINALSGSLFGDGRQTILFADTAGQSGIVVDGASHFRIKTLGLAGGVASGNGIEINNGAHRGLVEDVWLGYFAASCIAQTSAISMTYISVRIDQNNGYRPGGLNGIPASLGVPTRGMNIDGGGQNNNANCANCSIEGVGTIYGLQVGDTIGGAVQSFIWEGGTIEGIPSGELIYLVTTESMISNAHVEGNTPLDPAEWGITLEDCIDTVIVGGFSNVDYRQIGGTTRSGCRDFPAASFNFASTVVDPFLDKCAYGSLSTGPGMGQLIDLSSTGEFTFMKNNANALFAYGDGLKQRRKTLFNTEFELDEFNFNTAIPTGFRASGTGEVISRDTVVFDSGTSSVKMVAGGAGDFLTHELPVPAQLSGRRVKATARIRNTTTVGLSGLVFNFNGGATIVTQATRQADAWETVQATFNVPAGGVFLQMQIFSNAAGTINVDSFTIEAERGEHPKEFTVDATTTPSLNGQTGKVAPTVRSGAAVTITDFLDPIVGVPFLFVFDHAATIQKNAKFMLPGGVNLVGTLDDVVEITFGTDGIYRVAAVSVNA